MKASKTVALSLTGGALLCGAAAVTFAGLARQDDSLAPGVRMAGMDWGGKPAAIARAELEGWRSARLAERISLEAPGAGGRRWKPRRSELGADVDVDATLRLARTVGEQRSLVEQVVGWFNGPERVELQPVWRVDEAALRRFLKARVAPALARPARDARLHVEGAGFRVVPGAPGAALDVEAAVRALSAALREGREDPLALPVRIVRPRVAEEDLRGITGEVARFRTRYSERGNRARNILTACEKINGHVLKPGDRFSYNAVVGPRDAENGFRMAPVIVRGRLVPGMGGGICQVSTTLYNAVLLADLKVVRREHHAFPVHYVPAGRDATVAYGSIDFQFENNSDGPIALAADGRGGQVVIRVLGRPVPGRTVSLERTGVSSWAAPLQTVRDASLPSGTKRTVDKGHAGHRVTVWRVVKEGGRVVRREVVSRDHYRAFPRVMAVGTRAPRLPDSVPAAAPAAPPAPGSQPAGA